MPLQSATPSKRSAARRRGSPRKHVTAAKVLPNGRTLAQELVHKLNGFRQMLMEVEYLYPKRVKFVAWSIPIVLVLAISWRYYSTQNHRLLTGQNLLLGHAAFDAIRDADALTEDIRAVVERRKAITEAETQLSVFQQAAKSDEHERAGVILSYYLDEVRQIPDRDNECVTAMAAAQQTERQTEENLATHQQLAIAEMGELTCMSGRSQAIVIKNLCRDEAESYLVPGKQPPVDYCIFRHGTQAALTH